GSVGTLEALAPASRWNDPVRPAPAQHRPSWRTFAAHFAYAPQSPQWSALSPRTARRARASLAEHRSGTRSHGSYGRTPPAALDLHPVTDARPYYTPPFAKPNVSFIASEPLRIAAANRRMDGQLLRLGP